MRKFVIGLAACVLAAAPVAATPSAEVMSVVRQWVDGFNAGDANRAAATCTEEAALIDDFPPHEWHGPGACLQWFSDFQAMARSEGISHPRIALGAAAHSELAAEFAYAVVPVLLTFERKGKPVRDKGLLTVTLRKAVAGWRITGWVWSDQ